MIGTRPTARLCALGFRAALAIVLLSSGAAAQGGKQLPAPSQTDVDDPIPLIFSISGGISLGAYQAGVNWALLQGFQLRRIDEARADRLGIPPVELAAVTGASAGNINTVFWAVEWCRALAPDAGALPGPDSTLFWDLWIDKADIGRIFPDSAGSEAALFDREALFGSVDAALEERTAQVTAAPCGFPIGVTMTAVRPDSIRITEGFSVPTQRFAALMRAKNSAVPGRLTFHPIDSLSERVAASFGTLLEMSYPGAIPVDSVRAIAAASSSFPLAFAPMQIRHAGEPELFMDGGIFDNNPVGLALSLYLHFRGKGGRAPTIVYVNPGRGRAPLPVDPPNTEAIAAGGVGPAFQTIRSAIGTWSQYELQLVVRDQALKGLNPTWALSDRSAPIMSEHLQHFAGFLAFPFREHDFYVGTYDGLVLLAREFICGSNRGDPELLQECTRISVRHLLDTPAFSIPAVAAPLLNALYINEFEKEPAGTAFCPADANRWPADSAMIMIVACALQNRLVARPAGENEPECGTGDLVSWLLCEDELAPVLDRLGTYDTVIRRCALECDGARRQGARQLAGWIDDYERAGAVLLDRLLMRLREVEYQVGAAASTDWEARVEAINMLYYGGSRRSGVVRDASSVPPGALWLWDLAPYAITGGLGEGGGEARWEMSLPFHERLAFIAHYNSERANDDSPDWAFGLGFGPSLPATWIDKSGVGLTRVGAAVEVYGGDVGDNFAGDFDPFGAIHLYTDVLAGKLRLGWRLVSEDGVLYGDGHNAFVIGIADVKGLAYWVRQLRHHGRVR
ncbi:MAG TPA: patatin-like phospholipase family protein [Longimicrobiales bacterium]